LKSRSASNAVLFFVPEHGRLSAVKWREFITLLGGAAGGGGGQQAARVVRRLLRKAGVQQRLAMVGDIGVIPVVQGRKIA
jgi:hypothetical protein